MNRTPGQFFGDRNIAETIDALYRDSAAPRDHERLIQLVLHQVRHTYLLGYRAGYVSAASETKVTS